MPFWHTDLQKSFIKENIMNLMVICIVTLGFEDTRKFWICDEYGFVTMPKFFTNDPLDVFIYVCFIIPIMKLDNFCNLFISCLFVNFDNKKLYFENNKNLFLSWASFICYWGEVWLLKRGFKYIHHNDTPDCHSIMFIYLKMFIVIWIFIFSSFSYLSIVNN